MSYKIIDDYIPKIDQERILGILTNECVSTGFLWNYNDHTIYDHKTTKNDKPQMIHSFCHDYSYEGNHNIFQFIKGVLSFPEWDTHQLLRCKFNLNLPLHNRRIITPHIDVTDWVSDTTDGVVYLYYVNDSDGDTRIYPKMNKKGDFKYQKYFPVRVKPKKGRILRMSLNTWHSSDVPRKYNKRIVGNFVFTR